LPQIFDQNSIFALIEFFKIMYHPQSGWFDEGPLRGPATECKGLKAL
jgi:hypothetical protein